jgi:hypothetical protein
MEYEVIQTAVMYADKEAGVAALAFLLGYFAGIRSGKNGA